MESFSFTPELLLLGFAVALVAGFIDTLSGGGGLITLPALLLTGMPPIGALATNKLQGCVGTITASWMMLRVRMFSFRNIRLLVLMAFLGSAAGTIAVQFVDSRALSFVIPLVLLLIALYFIISMFPGMGFPQKIISEKRYTRMVIPGIGFYDGMFGPGTGSFLALSGISLRGLDMIKATAWAKPLNFATNLASMLIFLVLGQIVWSIGLVMMLGQLAGAWLGSHCLLRIKPLYLRILVVLMCMAMLLRYLNSLGA